MDTKVDIGEILNEREARYGSFIDHATLSQQLKFTMNRLRVWDTLSSDKKEALEMIQHKIARILNGDPEYADSWDDISGYATLISKTLK